MVTAAWMLQHGLSVLTHAEAQQVPLQRSTTDPGNGVVQRKQPRLNTVSVLISDAALQCSFRSRLARRQTNGQTIGTGRTRTWESILNFLDLFVALALFVCTQQNWKIFVGFQPTKKKYARCGISQTVVYLFRWLFCFKT